ncbi:complement receptor type 1-like [Chiroxiphia lanceolata]|uniref:complement receptor type 1-like n=1 Tax=Chiroxiphia lanceolata TaxID=296741 RepID=UPI0013CEB051|nr:complement receptor type 1-like [Chiroxiphia lanceolata]
MSRSPGIPCEPPLDIPNGEHTGSLLNEFHYGISVTYTCNPGFPLHGEPSIHCTTQDGKNGVWSEPIPTCGEANCPVPRVQNGRIVSPRSAYSHQDTVTFESGCSAPARLEFAELKEPHNNQTIFPVGRTVEYVCRPGYSQHPGMPPSITCLRNQTWSAVLEFCKRIVCAPPPAIPHGTHSGRSRDTFSYGDVVTYSCDSGHSLAGDHSILCTSSDGEHGVWSGTAPRCQGRAGRALWCPHRREVKCPPPPSIPNGNHSGQPSDRHLPGSAVQYSCSEGYTLIGNASIHCTAAGTWSRPRPRCEAIGCDRPEIKNGRTTGLETTYRLGDVAVFECDFGYALKGSQQSRCQFGGKWDPPFPTCEKMLPCPSPPNIKNGRHDSKDVDVFIPGMSVKYSCDPGYALTGKTTVSCLTSGSWSIPYPRCEVITCTSPSIRDGEVAEGRSAVYLPGANVTFQCHPGYVLQGTRAAKCQPDGRWVPAVPTCERVLLCPEPPVIAHATHGAELGANFTSGTSVNYSCQPGFSLLGDPSIWCTASGSWSLPYPRCAAGCGTPTKLLFAELNEEYKNQTEFPVGKIVEYTLLQCPSPPAIDNGNHNSQDLEVFPPGMVVNYSCDPGYSLLGEASIYCTDSGNWSLPLPRCAGGCGAPPNFTFAQLTKEYRNQMEFAAGDTVRYSCQPGYMRRPGIRNGRVTLLKYRYTYKDAVTFKCRKGFTLRGHHTSRCRADKSWDPPLPACEQVLHCSKPADITHGSLSSPAKVFFTPGTSVSYICDPGFSLLGTASIYCTPSGAWSHPPPICQAVMCLHPPNITNGKLKGNISHTFPYGASVSYSCNRGYSLVGNAFINCTVSGTWSQPLPQCKEIRCEFPDVQGVKKAIKGNTYRSGTNLTLECDDGYTLQGVSQTQCQEDFTWDPPVPACKLTSHKSGSLGLGVAAAGVLLLLGAGIVWKIVSKQKEGYYRTYENYNYQTPLNPVTQQKSSCVP